MDLGVEWVTGTESRKKKSSSVRYTFLQANSINALPNIILRFVF